MGPAAAQRFRATGRRFGTRPGGSPRTDRGVTLEQDRADRRSPRLGGSHVGYTFARPYDPALPTLVLINSYTTSVELYRPQFADQALGSAANLLALEPYGHGRTRASYQHFTYWNSAVANLQALAALGIREALVLGTS
ncbi:alpha/beta fold hydrolase [Streptomyces sp. Ac-502]|uniref:alpha/beta fold hydrolase n=1 Tax=Streptomyces sp. Ac-502 TaxID=3342801 RepID=UPI003862AAB4